MMMDQHLETYGKLALDGVHREFPYHLSQLVESDDSIACPRSITPVFYGCFDWHSAVHGHWLLAICMRKLKRTSFSDQCRLALRQSFTPDAIQQECLHLRKRPGFERPYGLAWLLALVGELHVHQDEEARHWRQLLAEIEAIARAHLMSWLPKLSHPIRCGTHAQTAFSMCLMWDWARTVQDDEMQQVLRSRSIDFHGADQNYPLHLEPSGEDFLSSSLGAASLMTRTLDHDSFTSWLEKAMPTLGREMHLEPVISSDPEDGRLTHLNGLNLSRAWMLWDIASCLDDQDERQLAMRDSAQRHATAGLTQVNSRHYEGSHWLGTFAAYMNLRMRPVT